MRGKPRSQKAAALTAGSAENDGGKDYVVLGCSEHCNFQTRGAKRRQALGWLHTDLSMTARALQQRTGGRA